MHFLIHKWIYWRSKVGSVCKLQKHRFFFSGYSIVRNHLFCNWQCFPVFPLDQSANYVLWKAMAFSAIENQINTTENSIVMCSNFLLPLKFLIYYCFRLGLRLWPFWASYLRFLYQGTIVRLLIEEMGEPQHLLKPMLLAIVGLGSNENRAAGTNKGIPSQHDISTSKNLWNKRGLGFMKTLLLEQVTWNTTSNKGPFTLSIVNKM